VKKCFIYLVFLFSLVVYAGEVPKPKEGMSVEQLIDIWYNIQYTKFAKDYESYSTVILINRGGFRRERKAYRARILFQQGDIDYKDYLAYIAPASAKGIAILTWNYISPNKEREQWLYLPSLKKARRTSPASDDDSLMGSVFTVEEITSWKPSYETYKLIGIKKFPGYVSEYDKKKYYEGEDCYLIEAFPNRKTERVKRTFWLRKSDGCCIFNEVFDKNGKIYKTIFRSYEEIGPNKYPAQIIVEGKDFRTEDISITHMDEVKFDIGLKEANFTVDALQKMKW